MPFDAEGNWRPNVKQEKILAIPDSIKEAAYLGGAGSGKSELLLMIGVAKRWVHNPRFKQVFMRRTFPELRNEIVPRSREIYSRFGATFNKTEMTWTFPRLDQYGSGMANAGGLIMLGHCENESDVQNYDSMEINLFTPDEVTSLTEFIYLYIGFTRVRTSHPDLPAIIRPAGMPGGVGHTWVHNRFIKPYPAGGKLLVSPAGNKRIFIFATLVDNKKFIDPNYAQALEELPEAEKKAKKYGDWSAYSGQVFSEFRDKNYPDEPECANHMVKPFEVPSWWPRVVSIDWGFSAMTSVGFGAVAPGGNAYVYQHLMFYGKKIEQWAPEVKYLIEKNPPQDVVICHSANQHRGDPHTIQEQVITALGMNVRLGERDRIGGKMLLHEYLRWEEKPNVPPPDLQPFDPDLAQFIFRNKGPVEYAKYLSYYQPPKKESNLPKLKFFDTEEVRVIIEAIKACVYEKSGTDGKKKEDVAEFHGDDPYDMLRMLLHAIDGLSEQGEDIAKKLAEHQKIIDQYQRSKDITAFYRNMRQHESKEISRPIQRHSRLKGYYGRSRRVH